MGSTDDMGSGEVSMDMDMCMVMQMYFYMGTNSTILFTGYHNRIIHIIHLTIGGKQTKMLDYTYSL